MNIELVRARSRIVKLVRAWFDAHGFEEMLTPRLVSLPGQEPHLDPFWTEVVEANGKKHAAALITSPEYAMKRLVAAGMDKIYDLGPCFRDGEPWDGAHDPEFLLLEWYRRDSGLDALMRDTEDMVMSVAKAFGPVPALLQKPWRRLTVEQAWKEYLDIDLAPLLGNREALTRVAREHGQTVAEGDTWDDLYFKLFLSFIEPKLGLEQPTFLSRYPASMAALARRSVDDTRWAERVELYIGPLELANGFAELSDGTEQRARFEEERALRAALGKKTWGLDERFLSALPKMGDAAGIAFGVDRLVMLLTGASSINDILPFSARERLDN